jgi:hypothetical protein
MQDLTTALEKLKLYKADTILLELGQSNVSLREARFVFVDNPDKPTIWWDIETKDLLKVLDIQTKYCDHVTSLPYPHEEMPQLGLIEKSTHRLLTEHFGDYKCCSIPFCGGNATIIVHYQGECYSFCDLECYDKCI